MKILELNFERGWRGGERQTIYNMQGFRDAGHEVGLVCREGCPLAKKAVDEGFKVFSFENIFGVIGFLTTSGSKYDVLHVQTSHILTYCLITKPFHRRKIIFSRRVDFVPKGRLTKLKYKLTDKIIGVSTAVKEIISAFSERDDVEVISDIAVEKPLNKERALAELQKIGIGGTTHIIGTTAALVPHKDPLTMVEAIRELCYLRKDFVFLHFGAGELEVEVKRKIEEYHLKDRYKLMGFYENVEDFFSVFEVFVMSSKEEGLGSSILDAFMYKVPVVATDAGGIKDILKEDRGVVCNIKDSKMLAEGINEMVDSEKSSKLVSNAFVYVNNYHSSEFITKQYLDVIKQVVNA